MSTVRDLISDALSSVGALGQGDVLNDADAELCLRRFIRMLGSWANENLTIYQPVESLVTLVSGTPSYSTILLSAGRPVSVASVYLSLSGIDYGCDEISESEYDATAYKAATGLPGYYYFDTAFPDGAFYFYPTPSDAYVAHIKGRYPLASTVTLNTTLALPEGYEAALCDNLAVDVASSFGLAPSGTLERSAANTKGRLRVTNYVPSELRIPGGGDGYVPGYLRIRGDT